MGTNTVTWTASDTTGNTRTCQQLVIVVPSGSADCEGDGLTDREEVNTYGTNPLNPDTDADGLRGGDAGNATLTNAVTFSTNVPPANANCGWSANFPSTGSGSTTPALETSANYDPLAGATQFTIMAWVRRESLTISNNTAARIVSDISALGTNASGFEFRFSGTNGVLWLNINGTERNTTVGGIAPSSNRWHHVAVVYDGTRPATNQLTRNVHFYVDGIQRGDGNTLTNLVVAANTNRLTVGNSAVSRGVLNTLVGKLDDVRILRGFAPAAVGDGRTNATIRCFMNAPDDFKPPSIICPEGRTVSADPGLCFASGVALGTPNTSDNCSGAATVTNDAPTVFPLGVTAVTWTATDANNKSSNCQQTVTVLDNEPPTINCPAPVSTNTDPCLEFVSGVALGTPTAADNCGVPAVTNDAPAQFPVGDTVVTWTATDAFGSQSSCQQTVTVYRTLSRLDSDFDGLHDCLELYTYGTNPYNLDTDGEGLTDGKEVNNVATDPNNPDSDNDFWLDGAELLHGKDPNSPTSFPAFSFTINGGADVVTTPQLQVELAAGLVADFVIVAEEIAFSTSVTNQFSSAFNYTLQNSNDGRHKLYLRLMKLGGATSPIFGRAVELDSVGPSISITSPINGEITGRRRINVEGFAADASTNAPQQDASRWLQVTVNGAFVNDRNTNGLWWSGLHDLAAGTNTFVAVVTDLAGFTATNIVSAIYDPALATNTPAFTMDMTNSVVVVGATTTDFALSGSIDDDNAIVQIDVVDAADPTVTNATIHAAVSGTDWWTQIPLFAGSNLVVVSVYNAGSITNSQSFSAVQDTNVFLEITSPAANTAVNSTNVTVVGRASTNFNDSITINGQAAATLVVGGSITFSNSVPLSVDPDVNVIEVHATGSDGSSATVRQLVYGYEVVQLRQIDHDDGGHLRSDCWFARRYPDDHVYRWEHNDLWTWNSPDPLDLYVWEGWAWGYSGQPLSGSGNGGNSFPIGDPTHYPMLYEAGWIEGQFFRHGNHLDGGRYEFFDCPYETNCVCVVPPYCLGENTAGCCIDDVRERTYWRADYRHQMTFIKRWPTTRSRR